ncbi:carbohydrate-binding module family 18 protein [Cercophora scortea]|uniref:Carbohydrate-binding module family 18 protein n=1 Tax=Cercophora scortea TaxID=314031 RepID=A0AAE0I226_9PEZI|nr:carbohydrate-binding module family 18 protein [Cercophora scortea]
MHLSAPFLALLLVFLSEAIALPSSLANHLRPREIIPSPDLTCGVRPGGTYSCPSHAPCCSVSGYCGAGDSYCLTSLGCQTKYAAPAGVASCYAPVDGVTVTPDNMCGTTGAGVYGYRCPSTGLNCCSGL